eukprot:scaffold33057_cov166-Amphora_coffeaeformis.AAC.1
MHRDISWACFRHTMSYGKLHVMPPHGRIHGPMMAKCTLPRRQRNNNQQQQHQTKKYDTKIIHSLIK